MESGDLLSVEERQEVLLSKYIGVMFNCDTFASRLVNVGSTKRLLKVHLHERLNYWALLGVQNT